jgi:hypothetical protein
VTSSPASTEELAPSGNATLASLLEEALADLLRLQAEAEVVSRAADKGMSRIATGGAQALRPTLAEGCATISRRLESMGHPGFGRGDAAALAEFAPEAGVALNAYRPCFSRLGKALREARRISDGETMTILSHLIVRLEKHLWLFDLPLSERRVVDWSAVNLFSLC